MVGFACALGVDMGFNTSHHNDAEVGEMHIHADGKKHNHEKESANTITHEHNKDVNHHHDNSTGPVKPVPGEKNITAKNSGGCCSDEVQKFQNLDKNLNQTVKSDINVPLFAVILSTFFGIDFINIVRAEPTKYKTRFFYPPPTDIRIAIQRFQI